MIQKTILISMTLLLINACSNNTPNTNSTKNNHTKPSIVSTIVDTQCRNELNKRSEWQLISQIVGNEKKERWEEQICRCVSNEAPKHLSMSDIAQASISKENRNIILMNVLQKSLSSCIQQIK